MLLFRVLVFVLLAFLSHQVLAQPVTAADSQPAVLSPIVVTNGWRVNTVALNDLGTVVFAGGQTVSSDGLVLAGANKFLEFAAAGDRVPGTTDKIFAAVLSSYSSPDSLSLNNRDEVAFSAWFIRCPSMAEFYTCTGNGIPEESGLFLYSGGVIKKIISTGDPVPETGGRTIQLLNATWLNNRGDILFNASLQTTDNSYSFGIFMYSGGQIRKIVLGNDPTPLGPFQNAKIKFNDDGVITFTITTGFGGVFHTSGTQFIKDISGSDVTPDGRLLGPFSQIAANGEGDIAFTAPVAPYGPLDRGLFLRRRDGTTVRIISHGDPSPLGGTFNLWYTETGRFNIMNNVSALVAPQINRSGNVVFAAPVNGGTATGGIFLYTAGRLKVIAADGDPGPEGTNANFVFFSYPPHTSPPLLITVAYAINDVDAVTFRSGLSNASPPYAKLALFQEVGGIIRKLGIQGDIAPGTVDSSFAVNNSAAAAVFSPFLQNDRGDVVFTSGLCCDSSAAGAFLSPSPAIQMPNGDFELPAASELPTNWQIAWSNSGSGEAFRFSGDGAQAMRGASVLRLHVDAGGGSMFVLSDEMPAAPEAVYTVSSWMRYNLTSPSDSVFFSVIQFDAQGNVVGFDEVPGIPGENYWQWEPKRLLIHTTPVTASVRIRFGLVSATESYLDVDAVQ